MNIDWRVVRFVGEVCLVLAAGVVLVHVRPGASGAAVVERISASGAPSAEANVGGVEITVGRDGLSMEFPSCNLDAFKDRFFLHVYAEATGSGSRLPPVNRDFDVKALPKRHVGYGSREHCAVDRSYGTTAEEVVLGQFTMPQGNCCTISWSRDFILRAK